MCVLWILWPNLKPSLITDQQDGQHSDTVYASTGSSAVGQIGDGIHMFAWHLAEVRVPPRHDQVIWDEYGMNCGHGHPTIGNPYIAHYNSLVRPWHIWKLVVVQVIARKMMEVHPVTLTNADSYKAPFFDIFCGVGVTFTHITQAVSLSKAQNTWWFGQPQGPSQSEPAATTTHSSADQEDHHEKPGISKVKPTYFHWIDSRCSRYWMEIYRKPLFSHQISGRFL